RSTRNSARKYRIAISPASSVREFANASSASYMRRSLSGRGARVRGVIKYARCDMPSALEETGKHTVRLNVEIPPDQFAKDLEKTYRSVSQSLKVPGFRKGHVPRKVIDAQIGQGTVLKEFLEDFLPVYYGEAVREH